MKQIIEKLKEQADDIFVNRLDPEAASWGMQEGVLISANEARQIVEALEGKAQLPSFEQIIDFATWYSGMEREKVERAYDMYLRDVLGFNGAETISKTETVDDRSMTNTIKAFDKFRSEYNRSVSNFNIDECIAAFYKKIENYASPDRKGLNEKMLKDLSAKELEDDVNRNKI